VSNYIQQRDDKLIAFALRSADRAGQQVVRVDEYNATAHQFNGVRMQGGWLRVKVTFVDGRHIRGWWSADRWQYGDRTWEQYNNHRAASRW
jgi:hypothetical protein